VSDSIIICRCEDLTLEDIRATLAAGATTMDEVKRLTRCGMGPCQGRTCRSLLAAEVSRATGVAMEEVALTSFRQPTRPIKVGLLASDVDA
jgi:NAD(P)H-nitrite reductase large subunit